MTDSNTYDEVPYEGFPVPHSHPDRMVTIAHLFGMETPSVETCRVLELGCGTGGNLIPMAQVFPNAEFVGIDLSEGQVQEGLELIASAELTNIDLRHASILDVDASFGVFDFIICHGVYSWVPPDVQAKILQTCKDNLAANGIAYVSYNTYPGWHVRQMVREMMTYHVDGFDGSAERISQARALLNFLVDASQSSSTSYEMLLHDELAILQSSHDSYLFHEHLEPDNSPIYFHEFMSRAEAVGLRFLGEAHFSAMVPTGFSEEAQQTLHEVAPDIVHMEQYMDFLRNRMFRQTLLCHEDVPLSREIGPDQLRGLAVSSMLSPSEERPDITSTEELVFQHSAGINVNISDPLQKAALIHLHRIWPASMRFENLVSLAQLHTELEADDADPLTSQTQRIGDLVLNCYSSGLIDVHRNDHRFTTSVGEFPRATQLARIQVSRGQSVTNLQHEGIELRGMERFTLELLDGTRDRAALLTDLTNLVLSKQLRIEMNHEQVTDPEELQKLVPDLLDQVLENLAQQAFLTASRSHDDNT